MFAVYLKRLGLLTSEFLSCGANPVSIQCQSGLACSVTVGLGGTGRPEVHAACHIVIKSLVFDPGVLYFLPASVKPGRLMYQLESRETPGPFIVLVIHLLSLRCHLSPRRVSWDSGLSLFRSHLGCCLSDLVPIGVVKVTLQPEEPILVRRNYSGNQRHQESSPTLA